MVGDDPWKEAQRAMTICNACRYCEGFCAVFPAMELRRTFTPSDLMYLSNLCHNCRACYYACQYAPPHQFMLNVPRAMAELRSLTYREMAVPRALGRLMGKSSLFTSIAVLSATLLTVSTTLWSVPEEVLFSSWRGEGAFYRVIPYPSMVLPFCILFAWAIWTMGASLLRFWKKMGQDLGSLLDPRFHLKALRDVASLRYLGGGGHGCNYPGERFSHARRWLHQLVFWGSVLCLASTAIAAFYDHFLQWKAPYPLWSLPVSLGILGGAGILAGSCGLMLLKVRMDPVPSDPKTLGMDISLLSVLSLICASGFLLLWLRDTGTMGILLAVHLGIVGGFFLSIPLGKLVHGPYRYLALVRNAIEQMGNDRQHEPT
jgi:citrate/tricarballylate utilization protein